MADLAQRRQSSPRLSCVACVESPAGVFAGLGDADTPQLAKYAWPAAQKGCASYAQELVPPFCAWLPQTFQPTFSFDP